MSGNPLFAVFIFLLAACIVVPLASRFRLGSVLGYLVAGVLIGPFGIGLIHNASQVMNFAEFGVIMMLFLIGLELEPSKLWTMRKAIVGLGGLQVLLSSAALMGAGMAYGFSWRESLACGMALSLSSTAIVLQMLQEKGLLHTPAGESSFAVLLLQDIAVIPILIMMPLLAPKNSLMTTVMTSHNWLSSMPKSAHALLVLGVITLVVLLGKYCSRHLFRFIAKSNLREVFTATSLALIVGITLLMNELGVSPALGAFIAGVVLAHSEYRHTLEADLQPFKGLLLGLFFISIGMNMDFQILVEHPLGLVATVLLLLGIKGAILAILGRFFGLPSTQNTLFSIALAEGGEFAFVLFQYGSGIGVIGNDHAQFLTLAVALSMALMPFLLIFNDRFILPRFMSRLPQKPYDTITHNNPPVVIAGYGRFGQVIGRFVIAQGLPVTILEKDADQIELLRRFGSHVFFGDASRLDLLHNAGVANAKALVVAIDDTEKAVDIVKLAREHFPHVKIFARARNRRHAHELMQAGADCFKRETFDSALSMAEGLMISLGYRAFAMRCKAFQFKRHDEEMLRQSFDLFGKSVHEMVNHAKQAKKELADILQQDQENALDHHHEGWG
ncbi:MAG: monovalent cation:proton antiporter-2 (CPA2) family protein [Gammaproteobacteria bacterium]|nr:monovalent cation:proton antiporter-2 (CPA2) family protein [Gammaproteobacteria bacterium]